MSMKNLQRAEGSLVVPAWPTQTWYPILLPMLVQRPKLLIWNPQVKLFESSIEQGPQHGKQIKADGLSCVRQH